MNGNDWAGMSDDVNEVVGAIGLFVLIIVVVTTVIVQVFRTRRARMAANRAGEYEALAQTAVQSQQNTERQLAEVGSRLAAMEARMVSLERVLKDVE
ncbi:hypothetical protein O7626_34215 [Micromonospora sp. WMMD1102]|uniref:hypothetical protein n=1 Tax=Micromonospora sp. WMMD1102 TaxID=3016105 RepID=UPI002415822E|nr:hypothetical protein [Micromonospora sp. WMMD1102]MDG4790909.1 hypothetical protein [Micromonospora sp. WMMD1102]